jgi:hypothetical protein
MADTEFMIEQIGLEWGYTAAWLFPGVQRQISAAHARGLSPVIAEFCWAGIAG